MAETQTQLSLRSVAATSLPLPHPLALPHHAASARVKSNCSADKRMHMVSTGSPTLATGGGATLVQQKAMANMINWALTLFMRPTAVEASLSLSRVFKPSLYSCNALCIFWLCNLRPFLPGPNKVVSCCFARNENANDGNHEQAVGQLRQLYSMQFTPSASSPWQIRLSCFVVSC